MNEMASFKFGDIVENGWASDANPHKRGIFIGAGCRTGRLNRGAYHKFSDGGRGTWEMGADRETESRLRKIGTVFDFGSMEDLIVFLAERDQQ